jgi:hypothetical protein
MLNMEAVGKWSYLVGLLVAVVAGLAGFTADWLAWVLVVLGILAALFFLDPEELVNYGIRYLVLFAVATTLGVIPVIGDFITAIANAMVAFFGPIILTMLLVFNTKQFADWVRG